MKPLDVVVIYFGSKNKLAKELGISRPAVARWKDYVPKGRAYQIEVLTNGKLKAEDLTYKGGGSAFLMT